MASSSMPNTRAFVRCINPVHEHEGLLFCGLPYEWDWYELEFLPPDQCNHHDSVCDQCWQHWSAIYTVRFATSADVAGVVESGDTTAHDPSQ